MYEIEDVSENFDDGFIWYSIIVNMVIYRAQLINSGSGIKKVIHVTDQDGNFIDGEEVADEIAGYLEIELNMPDDFDESDEWKEIEEDERERQ